ncbi:MAG: hypothetical protein DBX55_02325 [Verrucomicrobia bacterium]|nr:MAG: hypothetical protein DBX55_02325 [Verrucomicrobiota bacterium]
MLGRRQTARAICHNHGNVETEKCDNAATKKNRPSKRKNARLAFRFPVLFSFPIPAASVPRARGGQKSIDAA